MTPQTHIFTNSLLMIPYGFKIQFKKLNIICEFLHLITIWYNVKQSVSDFVPAWVAGNVEFVLVECNKTWDYDIFLPDIVENLHYKTASFPCVQVPSVLTQFCCAATHNKASFLVQYIPDWENALG